jgi:hypothetical protein
VISSDSNKNKRTLEEAVIVTAQALRFSLLLRPPPSELPELPCSVVLSSLRENELEVWLVCGDAAALARTLLALSDAGCAVTAAGLLDGRFVSPLALLGRPELATTDPELSGWIAIECLGGCVGRLRDVVQLCGEARWSAREPSQLRLRVRRLRASQLFDLRLRLVEPFRAPP